MTPAVNESWVLSEEDRAEVAETRTGMAAEAAAEATAREDVARVEDLDLGGVPGRLFEPAGATGLLLFLHGGGFVFGDLETHDAHCRRMAARTGWAVLAVHYRRAPEHAYPAAVEDADAVAGWLLAHAADLGPAGARLAVSGDSAGGNLALGLALRHPGLFAAQVLVYPFLDPSCASYDRTIPEPDFGVDVLAWFWGLYLQGREPGTDPDLDPLVAASFEGLPPTLVQLAELDVLTPTGRLLAERLAADGVPVEVETYAGVGHGFWRHPDNDRMEPALDGVRDFLAALR
ncbi:MAG: alpha/beta hydrolase [Nocardioides sp.]